MQRPKEGLCKRTGSGLSCALSGSSPCSPQAAPPTPAAPAATAAGTAAAETAAAETAAAETAAAETAAAEATAAAPDQLSSESKPNRVAIVLDDFTTPECIPNPDDNYQSYRDCVKASLAAEQEKAGSDANCLFTPAGQGHYASTGAGHYASSGAGSGVLIAPLLSHGDLVTRVLTQLRDATPDPATRDAIDIIPVSAENYTTKPSPPQSPRRSRARPTTTATRAQHELRSSCPATRSPISKRTLTSCPTRGCRAT